MPKLIIRFDHAAGDWLVEIPNSKVAYTFAGDTADAQLANVQALATQMESGTPAEGIFDIFANAPEGTGMSARVFAQDLFGEVGQLFFGDELIFDAAASLLAEIAEAGAALVAALAVAA